MARAGSSILALLLGWLYQAFSSVSEHSKELSVIFHPLRVCLDLEDCQNVFAAKPDELVGG